MEVSPMCCRYSLPSEDPPEELCAIIEQAQRRNPGDAPLVTSGEIFPTHTVPVVANSRSRRPSAFAMTWGYSFPDKATGGRRALVNARSETASDKPMFKDGMLQRRCLIPAECYYEWEKQPSTDGRMIKTKHAIRPAGASCFFMAGIYHYEHDIPHFVILTKAAAQGIAFIHDRMPVILPEDAKYDWLNPQYAATDVIRAALDDMEYRAV